MTNHTISPKVCHCLVTVNVLLIHAQTAKHVVILPPGLPVINPCDILQTRSSKFLNMHKRHFSSCYLFLRNTPFTYICPMRYKDNHISSCIYNSEKMVTILKSINERIVSMCSVSQSASSYQVHQQYLGTC